MLERIFPGWAAKRSKALLETRLFEAQTKAVESLPMFARDADENEWAALTGDCKQVATEDTIRRMQAQAQITQYTPQGRNALDTMESFVIGKEAKITASGDEKMELKAEAVNDYWKGFAKFNKFDHRSKELLRRTIRDGEQFTRWFGPVNDDEITEVKYQSLRFVDPNEIKDNGGNFSYGIETDPDDVETVVNYHRAYKKKNATNDLSTTEDTEVIPADEITHTKILVDSNVKRGISFFIGVAEYWTKYQDWLDGRILLNKIRGIFNIVGTQTGSGNLSTVADKFTDVVGKTAAGGTPKKKMVKSGTMLMQKGMDFEYKNLNINASDTKEDGRSIQLMGALAIQFPEYIATADAKNGNFASTMIAESPFVRMIEKYQDIFAGVYKEIFWKAVKFGIESNAIQGVTEDDLKELECSVEFDTLIHRDLKADTESYMIHAEGLRVASLKTISAKLGYNHEKEQEQIKIEDADFEKREIDRENRMNNNVPRGTNKDNKDNKDNEDQE